MITLPAAAKAGEIDDLFAQLQAIPADQVAQSARIVDQIGAIWADSGSASMDLLLERGQKALDEDDTQAAIDHFSALVDHAPEFAQGYYSRAMAYFQAGYYGPALADLRVTLALNPRHFMAMQGLAYIQEETGEPKKALETLRAVLKLNPNDADVQKAIAHLKGMAL